VTADASFIDFLIPEYWRSTSPGDSVNPDDRLLMNAASRPDGELARIAQRTGTPYMNGNDTSIEGDEVKTRYSLDILKQHHPAFMTIHLSSLDEEEHLHGPFSDEADKDLEAIDGMVGRLVAQALENDPNGVIAIVSDHGFANVEHATNLFVPFIEAGLLEATKSPAGAIQVKSWKAQPWLAGGMAAIMLHDPADTATREQVHTLLAKLAADPSSGIQAILTDKEMSPFGGFPDAAFVVTLKPGYVTGASLSGALVTDNAQRGTHGYSPVATPEMRSSFFIMGKGISRNRNLGLIDMRQIAPTLGGALGITMLTAKQPSLGIHAASASAPTPSAGR
jgi:predicted AlkP superfamily pyrophosphatase or phosphodiesterase